MTTFIPFIAAGLIAVLVYLFLDGLNLSLSRSASSRIDSFGGQKQTLADKLGDGLMARLGLDLSAWENDLRWAQIGGDYVGESVATALGQSVLYVAIGLVFVAALGVNILSLGVLAVLAYLPYMNLHNAAEKVHSSVRRSLPEAAAFVAGEIAGTSNRLMLSKSGVRGVFREQIEVLQMPHLASFAAQADLVAQRGAEGPAQMSSVAKMLAREYRTEVRRNAAELDNKLLLPTTLYFFFPMLAAMLAPLAIGIMGML